MSLPVLCQEALITHIILTTLTTAMDIIITIMADTIAIEPHTLQSLELLADLPVLCMLRLRE